MVAPPLPPRGSIEEGRRWKCDHALYFAEKGPKGVLK